MASILLALLLVPWFTVVQGVPPEWQNQLKSAGDTYLQGSLAEALTYRFTLPRDQLLRATVYVGPNHRLRRVMHSLLQSKVSSPQQHAPSRNSSSGAPANSSTGAVANNSTGALANSSSGTSANSSGRALANSSDGTLTNSSSGSLALPTAPGGGPAAQGAADKRPVLKVGVVGGSISWGHGASKLRENDWFSLVVSWLRDSFPGVTISGRNGCVPATPASLMTMCLEHHMDADVDLMFVEYALNDGLEDRVLHNQRVKVYERLVRRIMEAAHAPAVVLVQVQSHGQFMPVPPFPTNTSQTQSGRRLQRVPSNVTAARNKAPGATKQTAARSKTPGATNQTAARSRTSGATNQTAARSQTPGASNQTAARSKTPGAPKQTAARSKTPGAPKQTAARSKTPGATQQTAARSKTPGAPTPKAAAAGAAPSCPPAQQYRKLLTQGHHRHPARQQRQPVLQFPFHHTPAELYGAVAQYYDTPWLSFRNALYRLGEGPLGNDYRTYLQSDFLHPNDLGHKAMADMVVWLMLQTALGLGEWPLQEQQVQEAAMLPTRSMYPGNYPAGFRTCYLEQAFPQLVESAQGWVFGNDGSPEKPKWGFIANTPGAVMKVKLDLQAVPTTGTPDKAMIIITYLKSYQHMGVAAVSCVAGCTCTEQEVNGWHEAHESVIRMAHLEVTPPNGTCTIQIQLTSKTNTGEHKFRVAGVIINEHVKEISGNDFNAGRTWHEVGGSLRH